ncbi:hypothetical protein FE257_009913 [Aspergillus nanangensis]|uniref:Hydrophobin n=1 Tax=Aspergillus nanangensis TaxID=2582783 RepID=A0AAD4GZJ9_ASPNN|nr:hypothetical protein FE257_009913 [Aspergillus nanangensis]
MKIPFALLLVLGVFSVQSISCDSGEPAQCCNQIKQTDDPLVAQLLGPLGIVVGSVTGLVGVNFQYLLSGVQDLVPGNATHSRFVAQIAALDPGDILTSLYNFKRLVRMIRDSFNSEYAGLR